MYDLTDISLYSVVVLFCSCDMLQEIAPEPVFLTRADIARAAGVSVRTIERAPLPIVRRDGKTPLFDIADVLSWHGSQCAARAIADAEKRADASEDLTSARLRLTRARADAQEIANLQALGRLAPIELLTRALGDAVGLLNTRLETVPASIKRVWPEVPGHVLDAVERETAQTRNAIAASRLDWLQPDAPAAHEIEEEKPND